MEKRGSGKMQVVTAARKASAVLPPKGFKGGSRVNSESDGEGPVLPPKDPRQKSLGKSVYLPHTLWDALQEIANASGEYSRNEVIQKFLENRVLAWRKEQASKRKPNK